MDLSLLSIFGAGLLTFASPCVLPLVPIYLATLAGGAVEKSTRGRLLLVAAAFTLGLSSVFVALGALASTLGGALMQHRTAIVLLSAVLMMAAGLRALGVLRVALFDRDARPALAHVKRASTVFGAFLLGGAFALGWSPCIGPVLASVLGYAASHAGSPWRGAGYLALYAAGLSLPLLVVAAAASRASAWLAGLRGALPKFERATGWALLAFGLWLGGSALVERARVGETAARAPTQPGSAAPAAPGLCDGKDPSGLCGLPETNSAATDEGLALVEGVPRVLEFTAGTCVVCQAMRPVVARAAERCDVLGQSLVQVDVGTSGGRALADQHLVRGTPTFVLLDERGVERGRILGKQSEGDLVRALDRAYGTSCSEG